jgi:hypothetical protein
MIYQRNSPDIPVVLADGLECIWHRFWNGYARVGVCRGLRSNQYRACRQSIGGCKLLPPTYVTIGVDGLKALVAHLSLDFLKQNVLC